MLQLLKTGLLTLVKVFPQMRVPIKVYVVIVIVLMIMAGYVDPKVVHNFVQAFISVEAEISQLGTSLEPGAGVKAYDN